MARIGILALQGCIEPHVRIFERLGHSVQKVKTEGDLEKVERIVLPGGESTTMLRLLTMNKLEGPLKEFCTKNPVWGVCAGAILLAKKVSHPTQRSFALIDVHAIRNFYGSQTDSFKAEVEFSDQRRTVDFIRAPRLEPLSKSVTTLALHNEVPVMLRSENLLVSAFHPELGEDPVFHEYFVNM